MTQASEVRALLLSAGLGTRLKPLTENWPKCLMPIGGRPLLEYWLQTLQNSKINNVLVNTHHHAQFVTDFLERPQFSGWVSNIYESKLLGTASSLTKNLAFFKNNTALLVHADNWCQCDFAAFIHYHQYSRPAHCLITMMTFDTEKPKSCGIVETDAQGVVVAFHEKVEQPPGCRANGAVYLLEPELLAWLAQHPEVSDFSTQVLPHFIGRIATWHNFDIHRDIGTYSALTKAQSDPLPQLNWPDPDSWQIEFMKNPIHSAISGAH